MSHDIKFRTKFFDRPIRFIVLLTVLLLPATVTYGVGLRDSSFATGGRVILPALSSKAHSVAIQPDGKILASGVVTPNLAVARFLANGELDPNFGVGGVASLGLAGIDVNFATLALDPASGKIIVAGGQTTSSTFVVARFLPNGTPDTTFSGDGFSVVTIPSQFASPSSVDVQADGKIVVNASRSAMIESSPTLIRLNPDGSLDTGFGSNGMVIVPNIAFAQDMLVQTDGKLLTSGTGFIRRYNSNGTVDQGFGSGGSITNGIGPVTLLSDGRFYGIDRGANLTYNLRRYQSDGTPDATFSSTVNLSGGYAIAIRPNGEPVVLSSNRIYRFNTTGALIASVKAPGAIDLALQIDGRIVTSGSFPLELNNFAVTRYREIYPDAKAADFDRDSKSDLSVFRPASGGWYVLNSSNGGMTSTAFGLATDRIVPGDYDGDGRVDIAVFRSGNWYILDSFSSTFRAIAWGTNGDVPAAADYDGDGQADLTVFRNGDWYVLSSLYGSMIYANWGTSGDIPVPGNYEGWGMNNFAVYRPSTGYWYATGDYAGQVYVRSFGQAGDLPVPADYNGNGRTDFAIYRPSNGTWYFQDTVDPSGVFRSTQFGIATDRPAHADYDGDGISDIGVFRDGTWYMLQSSGGFKFAKWGSAGDVPVPAGYVEH
ncbi:MAG: hypothetical protein ABIP75_19120 [Pyrinomonadaceae bacterium]